MIKTKAELLREMTWLGACDEATEWVEEQDLFSAAELWEACPRADWLLWFAARRGVDRKVLTLAACDCARTVLHLVPEGEDRPRIALEAAEAWARGEATLEDVRRAADGAYYAARLTSSAYYAAVHVANDAAYAAAYAAHAAAYDDYAPYALGGDAYAAAAERAGGQGLADLVCKRITWEMVRA